ncbi:MAG: DUF1028 domain-containing protein [Myxococcota bacterium]
MRALKAVHAFTYTFILVLAIVLLPATASATWSIVAYDTETQQVAVGGATCLSNAQLPGIDLVELLPVIVVGVGGAAAQAQVDSSGQRRNIINNGLRNGLSANQIFAQLVQLSGTASHQHGVAGAGSSQATQTGSSNFPHASGVANASGTLRYAIQGNVLAGRNVVLEAEQAFVNDAGGLPQKLMAAMEAARDFGGDGRCSCNGPRADSCGAPPPSFSKSAHVGFMLVSRFGDTDGASCSSNGCATGDYYMRLNVADQPPSAPDPVDQLRQQFDQFQQTLVGRPDAIRSTVDITPVAGGFEMTLSLVDWRGVALNSGVNNVTIVPAPQSAENTSVDSVQNNQDGTYTISISGPEQRVGDDLFIITIDDGIRDVVIPPERTRIAANVASSCPAGSIDFETFVTTSFSNQDNASSGAVVVEDGGDTLALTGNRWRASTQTFNVTPNTVVEFDFAGAVQGEIHGLGFDEDDTISQDRIFRFWGTQSWGTPFSPSYSGSGGFESFRIPIGQSYTGSAMRLVFVNDKDASPQNAEARFRCVRVFEDAPTGGGTCALEQDFDSNATGWINAASATCSTGNFVRAQPTVVTNGGVTTQPDGDSTGGGFAFFTATNSSAGVNDVDGGTCVLESPTVSVTEASTLNMSYFHGQRDAGDDAGDFFTLEVSTDGGSTYAPIVNLGDVVSNAAWTPAPATTIPAGAQVKIRLRVADGPGAGDLIEAGLDDVSICPN